MRCGDAAVLLVLGDVPVRHGLEHAEPEPVDYAALRHRADRADVERVQLQGLCEHHRGDTLPKSAGQSRANRQKIYV